MSVARLKESGRSDGVRALQRGLDILRAVNASGGIRAGALAAQIGLPRPTVYRLLETLEELGYVERGASNDLFRVTRRALSLGDGYDASIVVAQSAGPILFDLGKKFVWPCDLSVYESAAMVIQETTHAVSPLSIDRGMTGRRLPMLRTSAGRAYLAWCGEQERSVILRHLLRLDEPDDRPFLEQRALDRMVGDTRARGYAVRDGGEFNAKTASLAAPILRDDVVIGCLSVIWIRTAMSIDEARAQFIAPMKEAALQIVARIGSGGQN
jgi:IclR family transcriptional regulator, mhp operon transcriptional activator